jgi:fermentation-respiration switch protein FrsA (DUF1100 family)
MSKKKRSTTLESHVESQYQISPPTANLRAGVNRVSFSSDSETLIGNLYLPPNYQPAQRLPAVVVVGSLTSVKEVAAHFKSVLTE